MANATDLEINRRSVIKGIAASAMLLSAHSAFGTQGRKGTAQLRDAIDAGYDESVRRIQDWIRIPTIAAERLNVEEGADYMSRLAVEAGFERVRKVPTGGLPVVFGTIDAGAKHTLGLYFMYDVKQYNASEWTTPPLDPQLFDLPMGRAIRGRGSENQKGPQCACLAAIHAFKKAGQRLPVNLVLVAEGEEEIGSPNFSKAFNDPEVLAAMRRADGVIIPSTTQSENGAITINLGAKGVIECEMIASGEKWGKGPATDIHSSYKAQVDSPTWHLVNALNTLTRDDGNTPAIDGWFEHVRPLTPREIELIAASASRRDEAVERKRLGVPRWIDDLSWQQSLERLASQPTVNIEGLVAGYTGPGGKTILPGRAVAKLDLRLVPDMTVKDCLAKLRAHLDKRGFSDIEVNMSGGYDSTATPEDSSIIRAQRAIFDRDGIPYTVYPRNAGSWPGVVFTGEPLRKPAGSFGLGFGSGAHAPNEYFLIDSKVPGLAGLKEATAGFVDFFHEMAR